MPKPFDATSKHLIEWRPADWLMLADLPVPPEPQAVTLVPADLSAVTAAADTLIRVEAGPSSYLAHVEFQSGADPRLDERVMMYNVLARWRRRLPIRSVIVLLRPQATTPGTTGRFVDDTDPATRHEFNYRLIRVWELPVEPLLAGPIGAVPLATIVGPADRDLRPTADRVRGRLLGEAEPDRLADLWAATKVLMGLRYDESFVESLMHSVVDMEESSVWQAIFRTGVSRGREEGREVGERDLFVHLATDRLGPPTEAVLARLTDVQSAGGLARVAARLLSATTWDELLAD